jgi:hypothetical protein
MVDVKNMEDILVPIEPPLEEDTRSSCIRYLVAKNRDELLAYKSPRELFEFLQRSPGAAGWTLLNKKTGHRHVTLLNPHFKWTYRGHWRSPGGWLDEIPEDVAWLE